MKNRRWKKNTLNLIRHKFSYLFFFWVGNSCACVLSDAHSIPTDSWMVESFWLLWDFFTTFLFLTLLSPHRIEYNGEKKKQQKKCETQLKISRIFIQPYTHTYIHSTTLQFGWWQLAENWNIDYSLLFFIPIPKRNSFASHFLSFFVAVIVAAVFKFIVSLLLIRFYLLNRFQFLACIAFGFSISDSFSLPFCRIVSEFVWMPRE